MHFVCCLKQVPDTAQIKIDPETNTLIREGVESIVNPYDIIAVEQAVQLREKYGGKVSAISMGPPQAEAILRDALASGADFAALLCDRTFAGADTLATSYTVYKAIKKMDLQLPVDIVLCGKQAIDGDTAQTGPGLATRLGFTQFTYVVEVRTIDEQKGQIEVKRKVENGFEIVRGPLPALLTVELELVKPRRSSLSQVIHSLKTDIPHWDNKSIDADLELLGIKGSPTWVRSISAPPTREQGPVFDTRQGLEKAVQDSLKTLFVHEDLAEKLLG